MNKDATRLVETLIIGETIEKITVFIKDNILKECTLERS